MWIGNTTAIRTGLGIAEVPVNPVYFFIARDVLYRARVN